MKKVWIEVTGIEEIRHSRDLCVLIPEDATDVEIKQLRSSAFDYVPEPPEWRVEESFGTFGCTDTTVTFIGAADQHSTSDCRLVRDGLGDLIVQDD